MGKVLSFFLALMLIIGIVPISQNVVYANANDDKQIYLNYLTSGKWRSDGEGYPLDNNVVIESTCMVDLDGNGTYELLISATSGREYSNTTYTKFFTIQNGRVKEVISARHLHSSGTPGATDSVTFMYDTSNQRYVLAITFRQNAWALYGDGLIVYDYVNGIATEKISMSNQADNAALDKKEYFINESSVTKNEYERYRNNYSTPTDSAYMLIDVTKDNLIPNAPKPIPTIEVLLNGNKIDFIDQKPIIDNGRTLVPLRAISEAMGATVDWNSATRTITLYSGSKKIVLTIDSKKATINGKDYNIEAPPKIINGRTIIPLRFISEAFGAQVSWNESSRTISITYPR